MASPTFCIGLWCGKACRSFLRLEREGRKGALGVCTSCASPQPHFPLRAQQKEGHPPQPWPHGFSAHRCGSPGLSAQRRLKTKLPEGCSEAWRYHCGKWSIVNTLALSSGVRNFLQGGWLGTSSSLGTELFLLPSRSSWLGQESESLSIDRQTYR